eukprot:m.148356 g.148356  ORF g.148356 m.148356 type:complete len:196 (+) comp10118_c0_seq6:1733-2320(+)
MTPELLRGVVTYNWQCIDCKVCQVCQDPDDEDQLMFCDDCDRGYHTFCLGMNSLPKGRWVCKSCAKCASCGKTTPGKDGARWRFEYDRRGGEDESEDWQPQFLCTLCTACSKLFRRGEFCPACLIVFRNNEADLPMVCCDKCDRWLHTECDGIDEAKYERLSEHGSHYVCLFCRGEREEIYDAFHRKNRTAETTA